MATAGDLCTQIIGDLQRGDVSLSDIVLVDIKSAIREYENTRFHFNELLMLVTLSATDTYALSLFATAGSVSDVIEIDNFDVIINSTRKYSLEEVTMRRMIGLNSSGITSYPEFFAYWNQALKVSPVPNAAYVSEMWAHVKFAEIAAGGFATTNVWTNEGSELIRYAALKRIWGGRLKDPIQASSAREQEAVQLRALKRKTDGLGGSTIEPYL